MLYFGSPLASSWVPNGAQNHPSGTISSPFFQICIHFSTFWRDLAPKYRFWIPLGTQLGPKRRPKSPKWHQKVTIFSNLHRNRFRNAPGYRVGVNWASVQCATGPPCTQFYEQYVHVHLGTLLGIIMLLSPFRAQLGDGNLIARTQSVATGRSAGVGGNLNAGTQRVGGFNFIHQRDHSASYDDWPHVHIPGYLANVPTSARHSMLKEL